jgi:hypothetical protein
MPETDQLDLDNKKVPDVSMEEETKYFSVYRSKHLKLVIEKDALDKFLAKLDEKIEKRKINEADKSKLLKAWVQSKARLAGSKTPLLEGSWDKETQQLLNEITSE